MKTTIATSFGLALMLAMGIFTTMLVLGMFTASKVSATDEAPTMVGSPAEAGVVAEYETCSCALGAYGPAPNFQRALRTGLIKMKDST